MCMHTWQAHPPNKNYLKTLLIALELTMFLDGAQCLILGVLPAPAHFAGGWVLGGPLQVRGSEAGYRSGYKALVGL